jgi:hypothetical protein
MMIYFSVEAIDKSLLACQIKVEDEEDNQCSLCGQPFAGQIHLMRHLANTHFKTEFPCSVTTLIYFILKVQIKAAYYGLPFSDIDQTGPFMTVACL